MCSVVVLTPHGRRQTVPCNPNDTIMQVLNQVCRKFTEFQADDYELVHHRRVIDQTQMFRFTGLPNNALLEMRLSTRKRVDEDVTLMLQFESGARITGVFKPDKTVYEILVELCPPEIDANGHQVVCVYMRTEIHGDDLRQTTLRTLGLTSGRAAMRVMLKDPTKLKVQANVSSPLVVPVKEAVQNVLRRENETQAKDKKPEPEVQHKVNTEMHQTSIELERKQVQFKETVSQKQMKENPTLSSSSDTTSAEEDIVVHILGERNALCYSLDAVRVGDRHDDDDSFYAVSVNDVKVMLRDLREQVQGLDDQPLLTQKMREMEEASRTLIRLKRYRETVIRVQFPDRLVLQGTFMPIDTVATVMDFVRQFLDDPQLEFHLFTIPPKTILQPDARLVEIECVPTALLLFGTPIETATFLKAACASKLSSPAAAFAQAAKSRGLKTDGTFDGSDTAGNDEEGACGGGPSTIGGATAKTSSRRLIGGEFRQSAASHFNDEHAKVPKWFKPTGK